MELLCVKHETRYKCVNGNKRTAKVNLTENINTDTINDNWMNLNNSHQNTHHN